MHKIFTLKPHIWTLLELMWWIRMPTHLSQFLLLGLFLLWQPFLFSHMEHCRGRPVPGWFHPFTRSVQKILWRGKCFHNVCVYRKMGQTQQLSGASTGSICWNHSWYVPGTMWCARHWTQVYLVQGKCFPFCTITLAPGHTFCFLCLDTSAKHPHILVWRTVFWGTKQPDRSSCILSSLCLVIITSSSLRNMTCFYFLHTDKSSFFSSPFCSPAKLSLFFFTLYSLWNRSRRLVQLLFLPTCSLLF